MNESQETFAKKPHGHAHVMPVPILVGVFVVLIGLTVVTVVASHPVFDVGQLNLVIAMGIATVKAILVGLFFMHLAYDKLFNAFLFITALFFVFVFISLTTLDTLEYQPEMKKWSETTSE